MSTLILISILALASCGMAYLTLSRRGVASGRLARLSGPSIEDVVDRSRREAEESENLRQKLARLVAPISGRAASAPGGETYDKVVVRLAQAGFRDPSSLAVYMGSRIALALILTAIPFIVPVFWGLSDIQFLEVVALAAGAGFILPGMVIDSRRKSRRREINQALPDAIDLMVVCVEAGLGMAASLARVASEFAEISPVLAFEFKLVVLETQAGKSVSDALRGLIRRTGVDELNSLVSMLIQTERFGTSLASTLRVHAAALRTKRLQRAEEAAQAAAVKMLLPAVLLIFPAVLLVMIGPGLLRMIRTLG
jgi:tight adherence protein C